MTHDFRETKIKILSEEHSRVFQEAVIAAGGGWHSDKEGVMYLFAKFIFVDADLNLGFENSDKVYFDRHKFMEIQFPLPTKGHVHAELMTQYAEDAKTHAEPWKLWQLKSSEVVWKDCTTSPLWLSFFKYRRKPKTHNVHGVAVPELRVSPEYGEGYYLASTSSHTHYSRHTFVGDTTDMIWAERGLIYQFTDEGMQAAILHSKAMLGID